MKAFPNQKYCFICPCKNARRKSLKKMCNLCPTIEDYKQFKGYLGIQQISLVNKEDFNANLLIQNSVNVCNATSYKKHKHTASK